MSRKPTFAAACFLGSLSALALTLVACSGGVVNGSSGSSATSDAGDASSSSENAEPFVGGWLGKVNNEESAFFSFTVTNGKLGGQYCEKPGKDCNDLTSVTVTGKSLACSFSFEEDVIGTDGLPTGTKKTQKSDFSMTLSSDGKTLSGTWKSTKCACSGTVSVTKQ